MSQARCSSEVLCMLSVMLGRIPFPCRRLAACTKKCLKCLLLASSAAMLQTGNACDPQAHVDVSECLFSNTILTPFFGAMQFDIRNIQKCIPYTAAVLSSSPCACRGWQKVCKALISTWQRPQPSAGPPHLTSVLHAHRLVRHSRQPKASN